MLRLHEFDVGNGTMDLDHRILAALLEEIRLVCVISAAEPESCAQCPKDRQGQCSSALCDLATRLMSFMLAHFEQERSLMASLRKTPRVLRHCEAHCRDHAKFTTLYNDVVTRMEEFDVLANARRIGDAVSDWAHGHMGPHDAALAELLGQAQRRRADAEPGPK